MRVELRCRPAYTLAYLILDHDETVFIERGAMAAMSSGLQLRAGLGGEGLSRAIKRRYLGGEPLLFTRLTADVQGAWVAVAPPYPGDVEVLGVGQQETLLIESGSLLAYSNGIQSDVEFSGLRTLVMHEGITLIRLEGAGQVAISAYGGIEEITLTDGEEVIVDTGHIVAFSESLTFDVGALGSLSTAALTGEGLVARFAGRGRILIQTRAEEPFRNWLFPDRAQNTGH
jgi:uncharacterized protein (TIGR00266 family)